MSADKSLSHLDSSGRPTMVDVTEKGVTEREAHARASVVLPDAVLDALVNSAGELVSKKGSVFTVASIAGVMAAKRTHELIPFCHPLGLTGCNVDLQLNGRVVEISAHCRVVHKTGVEMEALTAATVAALTVYDMCKACSHDIQIRETHLVSKTGGKQDFHRE
ncbi:MAG: cyclic pyranopterin monophosphate synthase MoaC [Pseudomonadota bacterium]